VSEAGELLGALSVAMPANDPMTPAKQRLIHDLASQGGLVLRNVRLVEELRATHRRLVTAQDHERRRLERNIHDGAQQQLVALSVKTRLARDLTPRDPAKAADMLTQIDGEIQTALEDLRDLARGIYPPLAGRQGPGGGAGCPGPALGRADLGPGLRPRAATRPRSRPPCNFSCLEALQNVAKYADASAASVTIAQSNGDLTFEVEDDGRGFDTPRPCTARACRGSRIGSRRSTGSSRSARSPGRARGSEDGSRWMHEGAGVRLAFRIVAGVFGVFTLGTSIPFAISSFVDESQDIHLIHNLSGAAVYGVLLGVGLIALAARPEAYPAVFQGLLLASLGAFIGGLLAGDLVAGAVVHRPRRRPDPVRARPGARGRS
jgi:hypothetical protein